MTFYYFAYGSNMLTKRLEARCPGVTPAGLAVADDMAIEFSKPSIDESGKATLRRKAGARTVGVLFEIPKAERDDLDSNEGVGTGKRSYRRCDAFPVRKLDGDEIIAVTYLARSRCQSLKPYDWYLALVLAGAHEHGFDDAYLAKLRYVPYMRDRRTGRCTRRKAIEALTEAGFGEWELLFKSCTADRGQ